MIANPLNDTQLNALAEVYAVLLDWGRKKTAADDILADESATATEATTQATRPVNSSTRAGIRKNGCDV